WLSAFQQRELVRHLKNREDRLDALPRLEAEALLNDLPSELQAIADRVVEVLVSKRLLTDDADVRRKARNFLINDGPLTKLVRGS
ncbi:MAG TPA: hypothetical protein VN109_13120, partial [Devosia sp.]|nr:hypothetical protein [Devosia sp.]